MNKISNISFGEIILSERLKNTMKDSPENFEKLNRFKKYKPDCYVDLCFTKTGKFYLKGMENLNPLQNTITARLWLDDKQAPLVEDILILHDKFQKEAENNYIKSIR